MVIVMESPPHEAGGVTLPQPLKFRLPTQRAVDADVGVEDDGFETPLQPTQSTSKNETNARCSLSMFFLGYVQSLTRGLSCLAVGFYEVTKVIPQSERM